MGQSEIRGIGQETGQERDRRQEPGASCQPLLTGNGQKIEDEDKDDRRRREACFSFQPTTENWQLTTDYWFPAPDSCPTPCSILCAISLSLLSCWTSSGT